MKDLIKITAEKLDIPEYKVRAVVNNYYKVVKEEMGNPTKPSIALANLGDLKISSYKIKNLVANAFYRLKEKGPKRKRKEKFQNYWNIRKMLLSYDKYFYKINSKN